MKIVLAPDKYKGSLTGIEFCNATAEGIQSILPQAEIIKMPLADGGDGTIDILDYHLQGERIELEVNDPLFRPIKASYFYIKSIVTAYIEMAEASGLNLLSSEDQNCMFTTSLGTGELISNAIRKGAKTIVLGIGGSATNDCGIGMAKALGYRFFDKNGKDIIPIGKNLSKIEKIDASNVNNELEKVTFKVACDVANPLYGPDGAAFVYAPQKGASTVEVNLLDKGLEHVANIILNNYNIDLQKIKGTGAAGGMGAGSLVFLKAELLSGIDLVKEIIDFDNKIMGADWIITGEGKLDTQTLSGKTIQGVLTSAKKNDIPVAALCGSISLTKEAVKDFGIAYAASILDQAKSIDDAMLNSYVYLSRIAADFAKNHIG
ncbi:MAG: glycerate kinase [Bacteroidota bacterium]